jgi:hypothetical protein
MDMQGAAHRFTIGRTLKDALSVYGRNFIIFVASATLARLVLLFGPNWQLLPGGVVADLPLHLIRTALDTVVASLIFAVVILGAFNSLRGRKATLRDAISGLRFVPLILAGQVILSAPDLASTAFGTLFPADSLLAAVLAFAFGIAVLVIYLMWWLFPVTLMIERRSLFSAMARSNELNRGQRWRVFALFVVAMLGIVLIVWGIALVLRVPIAELPSTPMLTLSGMAVSLMYGMFTTFYGVLATVAYYHLRLEKDGPFPDDAVAVFD